MDKILSLFHTGLDNIIYNNPVHSNAELIKRLLELGEAQQSEIILGGASGKT